MNLSKRHKISPSLNPFNNLSLSVLYYLLEFVSSTPRLSSITIKNLSRTTNSLVTQDMNWYIKYMKEHKIDLNTQNLGYTIEIYEPESMDIRDFRRLSLTHIYLWRQWDRIYKYAGDKNLNYELLNCPVCFKNSTISNHFYKPEHGLYYDRYIMNPFMACKDCMNKHAYKSKYYDDYQMVFKNIDALYKFDLRPSELRRYPAYSGPAIKDGYPSCTVEDVTYYIMRRNDRRK